MRIRNFIHAALWLSALSLVSLQGVAQDGAPSKYPLRLHILAVDRTFPTPRMQPNWCSGSIPALGGDPGAGGDQGGPCGGSTSTYFGGSDDFSGSGRGDLVTPPAGTQALSFGYEGCPRVRVPPGFSGLQARWKKPGKLEVLIPSDAIVEGGRAAPTQRCTFTVTTYEFVYLRLRDGSMLKVSQESYLRKPALRVFLSGGTEALQTRTAQTTSVKQLAAPSH